MFQRMQLRGTIIVATLLVAMCAPIPEAGAAPVLCRKNKKVLVREDTCKAKEVVLDLSVPVGAVIDWWRPNADFPIPDGYTICDGRVVADSASPLNGTTLPDLTNRFIRGVTNLDDIGQTGGSSSHSHQMDGPNSTAGALALGGGLNFASTTHIHTIFGGSNIPPYYGLLKLCRIK